MMTNLPLAGYDDNSYLFSLASMRTLVNSITIDSSTFVPREENIRFGKDDTIEIKSMPD